MPDFDLPMTNDETTTEETESLEAPQAESLARDLGLELTPEEQAEAEQMVAHLKEQFGLDEEPDETPEEEEAESEEPEVAPEEPVVAKSPISGDEWIMIDGRAVPTAEAKSMVELRQFLAQNPDKADAVRKAIEGQPEVKEPEAPKPPEWLDLEEPSQKFFWERTQHLETAIAQIANNQRQEAEARTRTEAVGQVNLAMTTFRTNHPELTEDEIQTVRTHAVALNIIPGLQQTRSGTDAVLKALDIAYMDHPEFRAKQTGQPTVKETKQAEAKSRKQKLAGLSGSSSGATRQPEPAQAPSNDREMRSQAAKWLSEQGIL